MLSYLEVVLKKYLRSALSVGLSLCVVAVQAIDNPDAPDYLGSFESTAKVYETDLANSTSKSVDILEQYNAYHSFLDGELNRAYKL
ncbi:hypothetical protein [Agarivorans sp. 1_MG-2023]|uniref:hypothetical protein n=1 Tax=Agarivorans sp. 1_MG-2023 TaxID=3062634 RepID=UPI0026E1B30D|nr:hypothetical protein [Agarivorans sp. 1_MG-2023]MDO6764914.1 hypothetical protein [Agarivorans sp. 1_MG-2023]